MNYYTIAPSQQLTDLVRCFWVLEGELDKNKPYIHRTVASACPELLFHYKGAFNELLSGEDEQSSFRCGVHAQTDRMRRFVVKESFGIFGVYLYPHALSVLFDQPALEFTNQLPDLWSLVKKSDAAVEERMFTARTNVERLNIMTDFLKRHFRSFERPEIAYAIKTIIDSNGQANISQLSGTCCLSVRQFERKFKEHSGFSPKTFSRITRFNSVIGQGKPKENELAALALDFGYYDQSHFIQDFKAFSGYSPGAYFSGQAHELMYSG